MIKKFDSEFVAHPRKLKKDATTKNFKVLPQQNENKVVPSKWKQKCPIKMKTRLSQQNKNKVAPTKWKQVCSFQMKTRFPLEKWKQGFPYKMKAMLPLRNENKVAPANRQLTTMQYNPDHSDTKPFLHSAKDTQDGYNTQDGCNSQINLAPQPLNLD